MTTNDRNKSTFAQARIIHFAFAAGILMFAGVAMFVGPDIAGEEGDSSPLSFLTPQYFAAAATVMFALGFFLKSLLSNVPKARWNGAREEIETGHVPPEHLRGSIVGAAVIESVGLFACVTTLLTGETIYLTFALLSAVFIVAMTPTPAKSKTALES